MPKVQELTDERDVMVTKGARAKSINLLLYDGTLQGVIGIEDSSWRGELYSAPRESMDALLGSGACDKYGVYLLLAHNRVYVGQSSDLAKRLSQHVTGKDWWENVVVLTTKDDSLDHTDIDWLESALIERAKSVVNFECDNQRRGNPVKVDRFKETFLIPYLDEALFLMELIGITMFSADRRGEDAVQAYGRATRVDVTNVHNRLAFGTRAKSVALEYLEESAIEVSSHNNYANLSGDGSEYFLNPQRNRLSVDWTIILNDTSRHELIVLDVPAGSLRMVDGATRGLIARRDNTSQLDLHLSAVSFKDRRSGVDFSKFLVTKVAY